MHIGLIGGIGPAATVAYYTGLVEAFKAANLPLELTISHADVAVLAANAKAGRADQQAEVFAHHLHQLHGAGCDVAAITALTGHFCLEQTARRSPLPLISATDLIDAYCGNNSIGVLGLLGSPPVLQTHLFGLLKGPRTVVPDANRDALGAAYMEMAMQGHCDAETAAQFISAGETMVQNQGADAVLLAGTDLGLVFDGRKVGYRVVHALNIHVDGLLSLALSHQSQLDQKGR